MDKDDLLERTFTYNYDSGKYVSKQYTKEELKEKINYYEEKEPTKLITKLRWLYEVKRQFNLRKGADKYPDMIIATLEYLLK